MKTSMAAETPHNRTCTRFPIRLRSLSLSLSFFLRPGRDCENHQNPNRVLSPWLKGERERRRETGRRGGREFLILSLHPCTVFVRGPSLPDLWRPSIRHYLWPRGLESLPKEAVLSLRANISPSSLDRHRVRENLDRCFTRLRQRERVYVLGRVEFVNGHTSVVSNNVSKIGWNNLGRS